MPCLNTFNKLTIAQVENICHLYQKGITLTELGHRYGVSHNNICHLLKVRGIPRRHLKKLSETDVPEIIHRYQTGESSESLATAYKVAGPTIRGILRRRGKLTLRNSSEAQRKCTLDETAFDFITEESAYWIGFLMADGCITDRPNRSLTLTLALASRDRKHVERLRAFLGSNHKIGESFTRTKGKQYSRCTLSITSDYLCRSLAQYGVVPRKSKTCYVTGLENDRHFWRGVFDGDGSIYRDTQRGNLAASLVGSFPLLRQFISFVKEHNSELDQTIYQHKSIYQVKFTTAKAAKVLVALYIDCTIALPRKMSLAFTSFSEYLPR